MEEATSPNVCQNQQCSKEFKCLRLRKPQHCRQCGRSFCRRCLRQKKKLDEAAQPDPEGVRRKVCYACFQDKCTPAAPACTTRTRTHEFAEIRSEHKTLASSSGKEMVIPVLLYMPFDDYVLQNIQRLLIGFKNTIGTSETRITVHELQEYVLQEIPDWQKSEIWTRESMSAVCNQCGSGISRRKEVLNLRLFGLSLRKRRKLRNCRVCGLALCKSCSPKDLLLFYEDGLNSQHQNVPKIAIIKLEGCPEKAPKYSMQLHVCAKCKEHISKQQLIDPEWYHDKCKASDLLSKIYESDKQFRNIIDNIESLLYKYSPKQNAAVCLSTTDLTTSNRVEQPPPENHEITQLIDTTINLLNNYYDFYSDLRETIRANEIKLQGRVLALAKNYTKARNAKYIDMKSRFLKLSKNSRLPINSLHETASEENNPDELEQQYIDN